MSEDLIESLRNSAFLAFDDGTNDYGTPFEAADRIEQLEYKNSMSETTICALNTAWDQTKERAEAAEAKLAKAVGVLHEIAGSSPHAETWYIALAVLAELEGKE